MAEKGDSEHKSIVDGSDTFFEIICTPCGEDNRREEATKYCPECLEYLCFDCTRHHGRQNATKGHVLQDKYTVKQSLAVTKIKCLYHPDRDIEMYCKTHDMVYCTLCIATQHRNAFYNYILSRIYYELAQIICEGISKLGAVKSKMNGKYILDLKDKTIEAQKKLRAMEKKENDNLVSIERQRNAVKKKIDGTEENIIGQIRNIKMKTEKSLNNTFIALKKTVDSNISQFSNKKDELKKNEEQLMSIRSLDAEQQFVSTKLMTKTLRDVIKLQWNLESEGTKSLGFAPDMECERFISKAKLFGHVTIQKRK